MIARLWTAWETACHQLVYWHRMNIVTYLSGDTAYYCNDCEWKRPVQ